MIKSASSKPVKYASEYERSDAPPRLSLNRRYNLSRVLRRHYFVQEYALLIGKSLFHHNKVGLSKKKTCVDRYSDG